MRPEDEFILEFLPILRRYLSYKKIDNLDKQLNLLEEQLQSLNPVINEPTGENESVSSDTDNSDKLVVDISLHDLKDDVQNFIIQSLGYSDVHSLLEDYPHLDGPICNLEI